MNNANTTSDLYYYPYDAASARNPHPIFRRLREESPLYYNEEHDFYALSRFEDVERVLLDRHQTYLSGRGATLDVLKAEHPIEIPPGTLTMDDPPVHSIFRSLVSRMFTPKRVNGLEPQIRRYCATLLDPFIGSGHFDFVADLGVWLPMRVISMLIGVPQEDEGSVLQQFDANMRTRNMEDVLSGAGLFDEYIDWRISHPSDDIMTQLMNVEFEDQQGALRRLNRDELHTIVNNIMLAGSHTTKLMIGWSGKLLADHPEQRRLLVEEPELVPNAIEEIMRFEPPVLQLCRYVTRDSEHHGQIVPAGSALLLLVASANRDDRRYVDPDRFDVSRSPEQILSFGFASHYCLGQALARLEGRVALEEVLKRFPEWEVECESAKFTTDNLDLRGWQALPVATA